MRLAIHNEIKFGHPSQILDLYGKKLEGESIDSGYIVTDSCIGYRFRDA
jgi:hypothetical protein